MEDSEIKISMTDFLGFVSKSGPPKLTLVKQVKNREEYDPKFDFWRTLRNGIKQYHLDGSNDKKAIDQILKGLKDKKKQTAYPVLANNYKSLLGRKTIKSFECPQKKVLLGELIVRVNPELFLEIDGQKFIIKLHFKKDRLSLLKVESILLLMKKSFSEISDVKYAIWDLPRKKVLSRDVIRDELMPLLNGEARSFAAIWNEIV